MSPWLGLGLGAVAGYSASAFVAAKLIPKYDRSTPLATEGHPCGETLVGDLGPCKPPLVCRPEWLPISGTCVTPETNSTIALVTIALTVGGAYLGYRLAR